MHNNTDTIIMDRVYRMWLMRRFVIPVGMWAMVLFLLGIVLDAHITFGAVVDNMLPSHGSIGATALFIVSAFMQTETTAQIAFVFAGAGMLLAALFLARALRYGQSTRLQALPL